MASTVPGTTDAWSRQAGPDATLAQAIGRAIIGGGTGGLGALDPSNPGDHLAIVDRAAAAESVARQLLQ